MRGHALRAVKTCLIAAALGLAVPAAAGTARAAPRQASARVPAITVHTRTVDLALTGRLLAGGTELIDVTGHIAVTVVTRADAGTGGTAQIISRLHDTTGVGRTTGGVYRFVGADSDTVAWPPDPIAPLLAFPTFLKLYPVVPPNPIVPPHPIQPVRVAVTVTGTGAITGIAVRVDDGTIDNR